VTAWIRNNLTTQGYCLSDAQKRELAVALRFSTGLCLAIVMTGLALQSGVMLFALVPIGVLAGFSARHPFDHIWNGGVRRLVGGPALPPNPARRRHAFKFATMMLAIDAALFLAGATTAALVLGGLLVAGCATVTAMNLCLPSEALAWWDRRRNRTEAVTT
jgi:hypothetical protein